MRRMKAGMYAVIGRVKIKPGHEHETLAMIEKSGVAMVSGFPGSRGGYWARAVDGEAPRPKPVRGSRRRLAGPGGCRGRCPVCW